MRVHVKIEQSNYNIDETFEGQTAEEVVGKMKGCIAKELSFTMRLALDTMSNVAFAQEVVKRLNTTRGLKLSVPESCAEFLEQAQQQGVATIET